MTRPALERGATVIEPKECLELAEQCVDLAGQASNDNTQYTLLEMAAAWSQLADELEQNAALWKHLVGYSVYPNA